ncbi:hybrid sensor and regulator protein [Lasius niger]|jgi:hypothetical protein|uniref:Hybrid sensor and regulator protein n=1 Tax=Lasius niger TaxID=67767 RepID=A0A0J7KU82_LASNI|nr:hybrid sensor and regulator protein [Lasius niger]
MEIDVRITETLVSINDVTLKIKKELEIIEGFVKENGHLHTVVGTANEILSKKAQEMGLNVADIINESEHKSRSEFEANLLDPMTSTIVTEKLELMNN